jgi:hypothetical protein
MFLLFFFLVLVYCNDTEPNNKEWKAINEFHGKATEPKIDISACEEFETLSNQIRDSKISIDTALIAIQHLIPKIASVYYKLGGKDWSEETWVFPLQSYSSSAIGGSNGNGYAAIGYIYFEGNKHGGHPAHDIFIKDINQDCKDDRTKRYVNVLSFSGGIVVATQKEWTSTSSLRGGKYVWIFDPYTKSLFYYAHNDKVLVEVGQIIVPGQIISTVGRSGLNAFKKRSPTHLHFTRLKFGSNMYPKPVDTYQSLLHAKSQ